MTGVRIEVNPGWHEELLAELEERMDRFAASIAADASRYAPRRTGKLASTIESYRVGPRTWRVHARAPYAMFVEMGTGPYPIEARRAKALYWTGARHPVRSVYHRYTAAQPYLRPAFYQERAL